jgi:hypothetical protein
MTEKEFLAALENGQTEFKRITFNESISIENFQNLKQLTFTSCIFHDNLSIFNCHFEFGIYFFRVTKTNSIIIKDVICNESKLNYSNIDSFSIGFVECIEINFVIIRESNKLDYGLSFYKSKISNLTIEDCVKPIQNCEIQNCEITSSLNLINSNFSNFIKIHGDCVISEIRFKNIVCGNLGLYNTKHLKGAHFQNITSKSTIFSNNIFHSDFEIKSLKSTELIEIVGAKFHQDVNIHFVGNNQPETTNDGSFQMSNLAFEKDFNIYGSTSLINNFHFELSKESLGHINLNDLNIITLTLTANNLCNKLLIKNCKIQELNFDEFYNHSWISLLAIKPLNDKSSIILKNSDIGKCDFFDINLNEFEAINISNSNLANATFTSVAWFSYNQLNKNIPEFKKYNQEIFRQLKFTTENQGNRIQSLVFKQFEMQSYKENLFSKYKWHQRIFNQDRFILWVGQTNNFGQSWIKPVLIFILFMLPLYFGIMVGVSSELNYSIDLSLFSLCNTWNEFCFYFQNIPDLINPVHSLKKVFPEHHISGPAYWLDFLLKLVSSFFIFQTIAAFRKFMK